MVSEEHKIGIQSEQIVIEAGHTEKNYWKNLWNYRELLYFIAWRDIAVRYKQTMLGILWVVMRPLLAMGVFTIIFGKLAQLPSNSIPYPILVFSAMLPWQLFASTLADSGNSIVNNANLITKVYFPRLILPLSAAIVGLVDFLIAAVVLAAMMAWYGFLPGWRIIFLPIFLIIAITISFGAGLWVAILTVKYRDFRIVMTFAVQLGLYISPVGFSSAIVPPEWRLLYSFNPMVGVIDGVRWALLGDNTALYWPGILISIVLALLLLMSALIYFRKAEKSFSDNI